MEEEIESLYQNEIWELVDRSEAATSVQCQLIFKVECDSENEKEFRARLMAKGYTQREGFIYLFI